jgi:hypothetical protein
MVKIKFTFGLKSYEVDTDFFYINNIIEQQLVEVKNCRKLI